MGKTAEQRRKESLARCEQTGHLTPRERLERLDAKLGVGVGAKKERARLQSLLADK